MWCGKKEVAGGRKEGNHYMVEDKTNIKVLPGICRTSSKHWRRRMHTVEVLETRIKEKMDSGGNFKRLQVW